MSTDLILEEITLRNIQSYGSSDTVINLNRPGTTMIEGVNLDGEGDGGEANGVGKAQPLYSKILTPTGWTTMKAIEAGDKVITPTGETSTVIATYPQPGLRKVYRLTFEDGRYVDADEDHIWVVDTIGTRINKNTKVKEMKEYTTSSLSMYMRLNPETNVYVPTVGTIDYDNEEYPYDPLELGLRFDTMPNKTELFDHIEVKLSAKQRRQFLIGALVNGVHVNDMGEIVYTNVNILKRNFIQSIVWSLGGRAESYGDSIYIVLPDNGRFMQQLKISSKQMSGIKHQVRSSGLRVVKIEFLSEQKTKCILIDHPHRLYITDNYVVTHNTTIVTAVVFALYGKTLDSKQTLDNLVNNINKKGLFVQLHFSIGEQKYTIVRTRKAKAGAAGNTVRLMKRHDDGSTEDITPDSIANTDKYMEQLLRIPYDIFTRIVIFSATHTPFLSLPARHPQQANQSDMIEHLFGLSVLSEKSDSLKKKVQSNETRLSTLQALAENQEKMLVNWKKSITSTKTKITEWETTKQRTLETLSKELEVLKTVDVESQKRLREQLTEIKTELRTVLDDSATIKRIISTETTKLSKKNKELTHLRDDKCPYCLQKYQEGVDKIPLVEEEIKTIEQTIEDKTNEMSELTLRSEALKLAKQQLDAQVLDIDVANAQQNITELEMTIKHQRDTVNPFITVLDELENGEIEEYDYTEIDALVDEIKHQQFLVRLLTKRDSFLRKKLLDNNIPYLNSRIATNLAQLGLPYNVEFQDDMSVIISKFGHEISFTMLSAGQKARVNLALSWAFRDVYQKRYCKVNVSILDEVLDVGLDRSGVSAAVRMLKHKARTEDLSMYVISHRSDEMSKSFDRRLIVTLENGFSRAEYDS